MTPARFVSESLAPGGEFVESPGSHGPEPLVPATFGWRDETLRVVEIVRSWRSTNVDRGDTYLARHWFEFVAADGRRAVIYYDRKALRNRPRWWLYSITT